MRRRTLLRSLPVAAVVGVAGCSARERPEIRMDSGSATLHPATDLYIANGLQPDGNDRLFVRAVADESPDRIGPDAEGTITDTLQNSGMDQFHVIVQQRSTAEAPIALWPIAGSAFDWLDRSTLRATVYVQSWGSLDRIDDETKRERLRSADDVIFTAVWSLTPSLDTLPDDVEFVMESRN